MALLLFGAAATGFLAVPARHAGCWRAARVVAATASATDEARLLTECRQDERSLTTIQGLVDSLREEPLPAKPKRELQADWVLEYASDADIF